MKTLKPTFNTKLIVAALAFASTCTLMFATGNAFATPYGTNITQHDGVGTNGSGVGNEDNEAEPGMVQSQVWDLEGFFLKGKALTIVGGYNFYAPTGVQNMKPGDIFIDHNRDAINSTNPIPNNTVQGFNYGETEGYKEISNSLFKYDYVLDIDWAQGKFNIVKLDAASTLKNTEYGEAHNKPSNPWKYVSGGLVINATPLDINTYGKTSQNNTGFSGWDDNTDKHYVATFDLSAIGDDIYGSLIHNTMECGNDNLIGVTPVPEPATMLLFGTGIAGLAGMVRRRRMHN